MGACAREINVFSNILREEANNIIYEFSLPPFESMNLREYVCNFCLPPLSLSLSPSPSLSSLPSNTAWWGSVGQRHTHFGRLPLSSNPMACERQVCKNHTNHHYTESGHCKQLIVNSLRVVRRMCAIMK